MLANYEEAQDSGTSPRHVVKPGLNVRQQRPLLARAAQRRCPQESPLLLGAFSAAAGINARPVTTTTSCRRGQVAAAETLQLPGDHMIR